jgi:hypothetical protein
MAVTVENFAYRANFPGMSNDTVEQAISAMSIQWSGTQEFWGSLSDPLRQQKRDLILSLLVAWHLADMYPEMTEGVMNNAGMPLEGKESGGVILRFLPLSVQEAMYPFLTNTFGIRALQMIMSAPERFKVRGDQGLYQGGTY